MKKRITVNSVMGMPIHTYYVDATGGNDTNSGLSVANPLQTIAAVNALTLKPGDRVLFKCGETWANTTLKPIYGGSPARPVWLSAYGSGARPQITHATASAGWIQRDYTIVDGLYFAGDKTNGDDALKIKAAHVTVNNCELCNAKFNNLGTNDVGTLIHHLVITNNLVHDSAKMGIYIGDSDGTATNGPADCLVRGNTCYLNGTSTSADHGIYLQYAIRCFVQENICYDNKGAGLKFNSLHDSIGERNYLYSSAARGTQRYGLFVDEMAAGENANNIFRNNKMFENLVNIQAQVTTANVYYHNTLVNAGNGASGAGAGGVVLTATCANQVFRNNIIFQDRASINRFNSVYRMDADATVAANTFNNNLVFYNDVANFANITTVNKTWAEWQAFAGSPDPNSTNGDAVFQTVNTTTTTVNGDSASGQTVLNVANTVGFAVNSPVVINSGGARDEVKRIASIQDGISLTMTSNLLYTHTGAQADVVHSNVYADLHIQTTSPAKNAGATGLGVLVDFDNVVRDANPDIGAYEYVA